MAAALLAGLGALHRAAEELALGPADLVQDREDVRPAGVVEVRLHLGAKFTNEYGMKFNELKNDEK